jgi:hypothetical protein
VAHPGSKHRGGKHPGIEVISSPGEHAVVLPQAPAAASRAVASAASEWGAELEPAAGPEGGGQLHLPVVAGLRRGLLSGPLTVEAAGQGSRVVFRPATADYYLETSVVALLVVAAAGALLTVAWPLFPQLLPGAPLGGVLAVGGWMLLAPRLRGRGPEEFLASVADHSESGSASRE